MSSPFSSFIQWKIKQFLRIYWPWLNTCEWFFKNHYEELIPDHINYSLSFLSASNLWKLYERKLTVSVIFVSWFSPLILFSCKCLCLLIFRLLWSQIFQAIKKNGSTVWTIQPFFKNIMIPVTATWCCFFHTLTICVALRIITRLRFYELKNCWPISIIK